MSRGRKERTPAQLAVLAQAREKAKIVIALLPFVESVDLSTSWKRRRDIITLSV